MSLNSYIKFKINSNNPLSFFTFIIFILTLFQLFFPSFVYSDCNNCCLSRNYTPNCTDSYQNQIGQCCGFNPSNFPICCGPSNTHVCTYLNGQLTWKCEFINISSSTPSGAAIGTIIGITVLVVAVLGILVFLGFRHCKGIPSNDIPIARIASPLDTGNSSIQLFNDHSHIRGWNSKENCSNEIKMNSDMKSAAERALIENERAKLNNYR